MCLRTQDPTIRVTEDDILVYKTLRYDNGDPESLAYNFVYKKFEACPTEYLLPQELFYRSYYYVEKGYHSDVKQRKDSNALFVIPKGTKYIKGRFNDWPDRANYVSETIVYLGRLKPITAWFTKIYLKLKYRRKVAKNVQKN